MTETYAPPGNELTPNVGETEMRPEHRPHSIFRGLRSATLQKETALDEERTLQQIVYDEAIVLACDWLEATGGKVISKEEFQSLHDKGYASSKPADILEIFYDWEDYQSVALSYFQERENPEATKRALVESLRQEAAIGLVPTAFFRKAETYQVDNPSGKKKLARYRLTDEEASNEVILQRYYKYIVADSVTRNRDSNEELTEERKINIALGFTLKTEKPLSTFYSSLKNSNSSLTEEQLALAIEELDAYDFIYPDSRKKHLSRLVEAGQPLQPVEYYYNLNTKRIIMLGRTALQDVGVDEGREYLEYLFSKDKLLIGEKAVRAYKKDLSKDHISNLADIFLTPESEFGKISRNHYQYKEFDADSYISYGKWILSVMSDRQVTPTIQVLRTAGRLDLGPGEKAVIAKFGTMRNYFESLGFANTSKKNHFIDWSFEDHVRNIQRIAEEIGKRPTRGIINQRIKEGYLEPSPNVISASYGFTKVLDAAGFPPYNKAKSREELIRKGLDFYAENNRFPTKKDFITGSFLGGYTPLYKLFGGSSEYNLILEAELNDETDDKVAA